MTFEFLIRDIILYGREQSLYQMEMKMDLPVNVRLSENRDYVSKLQEVMAKNGGYCPCRLQRTPENICICEEFKQQIADPEFAGYCHCRLYYKEK